MTKRTKKSVGTRRRKNRTDHRKKTFRKKKYRNRKTKRGYRGGEGSDDEEEETKEESVADIATGLRNLDVNQGSSSSSNVDNITSGVENLNVNAAEEIDDCPICYEPFTDTTNGQVLYTICGHKFHNNCLSKWCDTHNTCPICRGSIKKECDILNIIKNLDEEPQRSRYIFELIRAFINNGLDEKTPISENTKNFLRYAIKSMLSNPNFDINRISMVDLLNLALTSKDPEIIDLVRTTILNSAGEDIHSKFRIAVIIEDEEMIDTIMGMSAFNPTIGLYKILGENDTFSKSIKKKLLADSSINPNENIYGQTLFAHAIQKNDEDVVNDLFENPLLQAELTSDGLIQIKRSVYSDSKARGLLQKILTKMKKKENKSKFPKINFKRDAFALLMSGGK